MHPGAVTLAAEVMLIRSGGRRCASEPFIRPAGREVRAEIGPVLARVAACACRRPGPELLLATHEGALVRPEPDLVLAGRLLELAKALLDQLGHQAKLA